MPATMRRDSHPWRKCGCCGEDLCSPVVGIWICRRCDVLKDWPRYQSLGS